MNKPQQMMHSNQNYKIMARIKQSTRSSQSMIELENENFLQLKDISQNKQMAKQSQGFGFNHIFGPSDSQSNVFDKVYEETISKSMEGHNVAVIAYGQQDSGKSFTIFGENKEFNYKEGQAEASDGILIRTFKEIFRKEQELEDVKDITVTANFYEIYLDQIRDLGVCMLDDDDYRKKKNYFFQNLDIIENSNGQVQVKYISQISIKSMKDVYEMIRQCFELRVKNDNPQYQIWNRAHTIVNLNLIQKDRENENMPYLNSTIQFVDLAGSQRIAKSLVGGVRFQDSIMISSSLVTLGKCLQQISQQNNKNVPYKDNKLTRCIQNCITPNSHILLVAHIVPEEKYFEECLSTLQFVDRTKSLTQRKKAENNIFSRKEVQSNEESPQQNNQEKMVGKLHEEISDIKQKIEIFVREQRRKLQDLKSLLGLDSDVEKIISKPTEKDIKQFKIQREAINEIEDINVSKHELEMRLKKLTKNKEELIKDNFNKQEKFIAQILELKEMNKKYREYIKVLTNNLDQNKAKIELLTEEENTAMSRIYNQMVDEKVHYQKYIPTVQDKVDQNFNSYNTEVYTSDINLCVDKYQKSQLKLVKDIQQYQEYSIKKLNQQKQQMQKETKEYEQKCRDEYRQLKTEIQNIYEVIQKYRQIIENVELGLYSSKILSIPNNDKPQLPNRMEHPSLFTFLDKKHVDKQIQQKTLDEAQNQLKLLKSQSLVRSSYKKKVNSENDLETEKNINFDTRTFNFKRVIGQIQEEELKNYIKQIKLGIQQYTAINQDIQQKIESFEKKYQEVDIDQLINEKESYKKLYEEQQMKKKQICSVIQSQQRLLEKQKDMSQSNLVKQKVQMKSRPQSVQTYISHKRNVHI